MIRGVISLLEPVTMFLFYLKQNYFLILKYSNMIILACTICMLNVLNVNIKQTIKYIKVF